MQLSAQDLRAFNDCVGAIYQQQDLPTFPSEMLKIAARLIASDATAYNEIFTADGRTGQIIIRGMVLKPRHYEAFERHLGEHPLIQHARKHPTHRALRISDVIPNREFRRSTVYNEFFREVGIQSQMAIGIITEPKLLVGIALNRTTSDFSEREKLLLDLLSPHVCRAHRTAGMLARANQQRQQMHGWMEELGIETIAVRGRCSIDEATPNAQRLLTSYFPQPGRRADRLPSDVRDWLAGAMKEASPGMSEGAMVAAGRPLIAHQPGRWLVVRRSLHSAGDGVVLLLREHCIERRLAALQALGLTRREAQVLVWLSAGKTDSEITLLLDMSRRTIEKHLEHIFRKIGVSNRVSAVVWAAEALL